MKVARVCALVLAAIACCAGIAYVGYLRPLWDQQRKWASAMEDYKALYILVYCMISDGEAAPQSVEEILAYAKRESHSTHQKRTTHSSPQSVEEVLANQKTAGLKYYAKMTGLDPWGMPYHVETHKDRNCPRKEGCYLVVIRSYGPNRRDDFGVGDDPQLFRSCRPPNRVFKDQ